jgi:NAD(P)-dependent dehydrogenase (short-subunit alcohol dehydrogenase family)
VEPTLLDQPQNGLQCLDVALPYLRETGAGRINVGADAATRAAAGMGAYAASKAGVLRLTESLAESYHWPDEYCEAEDLGFRRPCYVHA